jgi:hypothetical protein
MILFSCVSYNIVCTLQYYSTPGGCKFGKACKYLHLEGKEGKAEVENVELNFLGLPLRPVSLSLLMQLVSLSITLIFVMSSHSYYTTAKCKIIFRCNHYYQFRHQIDKKIVETVDAFINLIYLCMEFSKA